MNISKMQSTFGIQTEFGRELAAYMEEKYGIDIDEVLCEAIREVEYEKNSSNNRINSSTY